MEVILLLIRIFLFAVFALAGIGKLLDLQGSEKAVKEFGVPEDFAKPVCNRFAGCRIAFSRFCCFRFRRPGSAQSARFCCSRFLSAE